MSTGHPPESPYNTGMPDILLATINARYAHASLALRSLHANLGEFAVRAAIREFILGADTAAMAEQLLADQPRIIGLGVSIWNAAESAALIRLLKAVAPETVVVLGGPEVSHLPHRVDFSMADYIIAGEGETAFRELCIAILAGNPPAGRTITAAPEDPALLAAPYPFYSNHDLATRVTYVEASRGCPFGCEFCLSSLDKEVRYFPLEPFLASLESLWQRGARHFKFVDRTFNLDMERALRILDFFLEKEPPYLLHLEMVPENFPDGLKERLSRFPPAVLQLEVGIQTLDPAVAARIGRRLDMEKIVANLRFLREKTTAHLHVDLILGLPGESVASFGAGLDRLVALTGSEVQLGVLKKLSGTTLSRHDGPFGMVWQETPPYTLLQNGLIPFAVMQGHKRFARYWDMVYNSGTFRATLPFLFPAGAVYCPFLAFSRWLYLKSSATHGIALERLSRFLFDYLTEECGADRQAVAAALAGDVARTTGKSPFRFLRELSGPGPDGGTPRVPRMNRRQLRHGNSSGHG